jgi:MFS transporter, DHA1 family, inner membrane transport protein
LTLAYILGLPLGTFIGQTFGWRFTFWAITLLGVLAITGIFSIAISVTAFSWSLDLRTRLPVATAPAR